MKNICRLLAAALALGAAAAPPEAFRAHGPLYPVIERNLLEAVRDAAAEYQASGRAQTDFASARGRAIAWAAAPPAVSGLQAAVEPAVRMFDPSVTLAHAVVDAAGNTLVPAGRKVNPLDTVALDGRLLLFDAGDPAQLQVAVRLVAEEVRTRAILVAGSPAEFARRSGRRAYFDQNGAIVRRFGISELPAVVSQHGRLLRIETLVAGKWR